MEAPLTRTAFEEALVRHATPTLAGLKPASLFTFVGSFALDRRASSHRDQHHPSSCVDLAGWECVRARRRALLDIVETCNRELSPAGVAVHVLVWRGCGATLLVERRAALARQLSAPRIARQLLRRGYNPADPDACIELLGKRLAVGGCRRERAKLAGCDEGESPRPSSDRAAEDDRLPHELGFFLGYPYEDVMGFIEHQGRGFICFGCWKVYANPRRAWRSFSQYKRCTERYKSLYAAGMPLSGLASPSARIAMRA